jgi:hypothetical protein
MTSVIQNSMIIHVITEIIIVGSLTVYFIRKTNKLQASLNGLTKQLEEMNSKYDKLQTNVDKQFKYIYSILESNNKPPPKVEEGLKRRHKINIVPLDDDEVKPSPTFFEPYEKPVEKKIFPMESLFGLMSSMHTQPHSHQSHSHHSHQSHQPQQNQQKPPMEGVVLDDDYDIKEELELLNKKIDSPKNDNEKEKEKNDV